MQIGFTFYAESNPIPFEVVLLDSDNFDLIHSRYIVQINGWPGKATVYVLPKPH